MKDFQARFIGLTWCSSRWLALAVLLGATLALVRVSAAQKALPEPRLTFLDNGEVRVGMDLALGGAVTFISSRDHPSNIINSADLGRQIQMSHYSGPWPYEVGDKKPDPHWAGLGWNPIQTGDCQMNPSRVIEYRNNTRDLYIKCIPMQWPLDNVPGDCFFETWTALEGPIIHMRFRCTNHRKDQTFYRPCPQELPAVYTISKLCRLVSYTGPRPYTGDALTEVHNDWHASWPWTAFVATERWAALVDTNDWGLGVFKNDGGEFHGGIYGDRRSDDPKDASTAYLAPIHRENFDYNIVYEHRTEFMLGSIENLRRRFNAMATKAPPKWEFTTDRQHWTLHRANDQGLPFHGQWQIQLGSQKPRLEGPPQCWRAEGSPTVELKIAFSGQPTQARLLWKCLGDDLFADTRSRTFDLVPAVKPRTYRVELADSPQYQGLITGLALEPLSAPQPGAAITIKDITLMGPR